MIRRRDLLIGGACVTGAVAGQALRPHRNVSLLGDLLLADIVPASFGGWRSSDVGDPLALNSPEGLTAQLYNQLLVRLYTNQEDNAQVMVLLAYGARQTDQLQLHRPEVCYPAFGFSLVSNEAVELPIGGRATVPARRLVAQGAERNESVLYWSRIGEYLPIDAGQQRKQRFQIAMQGIIPDGLLSRFSSVPSDSKRPWAEAERFIPALIQATPTSARKVLIGTERAGLLRS